MNLIFLGILIFLVLLIYLRLGNLIEAVTVHCEDCEDDCECHECEEH